MIEAALSESRGQVFGPSGAAAILGMPRSTVESKIRSLKINKNHFKNFAATLSRRFCLESVLYRNVSSLPSTTSCTQSMASATLVIYSLPKLGISGTLVPGGDSSAFHPCRLYFALTADAIRSYCCLLLPRGSHKSRRVNEKAGRGGGDRNY
jgi:hypothetical protein